LLLNYKLIKVVKMNVLVEYVVMVLNNTLKKLWELMEPTFSKIMSLSFLFIPTLLLNTGNY
jgi:hypothetical protein